MEKGKPLISVDDLKLLIHKESGYQIQIRDNDPLLSVIYTNLAVLGKALEAVDSINSHATRVMNSLPGAADKEMARAGNAVIAQLADYVGRTARVIAGDAVKAHQYKSLCLAVVALAIAAAIFGSTGYLLRKSLDSLDRQRATERTEVAEGRATAAELKAAKAVEAASAEAEARATKEIEAARSAAKWAATPEGQLAKRFFDGNGEVAAKCGAATWEIVVRDGVKYCVPKRKPLLGDDKEYGWVIP